MLLELTVEQFAVIDHARLTLKPGLNVVTGETGAGKSLLVEALSIALGSRADRRVIRAGASVSRVEAVFNINWTELPSLRSLLAGVGISDEEDGTLVLSREVQRVGASLCRINGRTVPMNLLRETGHHLVDIHGQGDQIALLRPSWQLYLLDKFGGLADLRSKAMNALQHLRHVQAEMEAFEVNRKDHKNRQELLAYQVEEISKAELSPGEDQVLVSERETLLHAQEIAEACLKAHQGLYGGTPSAFDLISQAKLAVSGVPDPEGRLARQIKELMESIVLIEEAARELRLYGEMVGSHPQRLAQIEERLDVLTRLQRKYGGTIGKVLAFHEQGKQELEASERILENGEHLEKLLESARKEAGQASWVLSVGRYEVARNLEDVMARELLDLGMEQVQFTVGFDRRIHAGGLPSPDGLEYEFTETGIDRVEFLVATNPGEEAQSLAKTASGGEVSRLMLALKSALQANSGVPTLLFDEIDSGVGGRSGEILGSKLSSVSCHHQVMCVTHLPQIAAFADAHFRVDKAVLEQRTFAQVNGLSDKDRITELATMLAGAATPKAIASAKELLANVMSSKGRG